MIDIDSNCNHLPEKIHSLSYDLEVSNFLKTTSNTEPPVSVTTAIVGSSVNESKSTPWFGVCTSARFRSNFPFEVSHIVIWKLLPESSVIPYHRRFPGIPHPERPALFVMRLELTCPLECPIITRVASKLKERAETRPCPLSALPNLHCSVCSESRMGRKRRATSDAGQMKD